MLRVLDYVEQHLDDDLDLELMSGIAAFSKFHFHRQFKALFGISVHRYIQLARLRRASQQLATGGAESVTEVAVGAGYSAPDAFARVFRQRFGQSPSRFRKSPDWEPWLAAVRPLNIARSKVMQTTFDPSQVTICQVPPVRIAVFEHHGNPDGVEATVRRFIDWRKAAGLSPRTNPTFSIWYSERRPPDPADYRMDICVGLDADHAFKTFGETVKEGQIPGGRCAVLRVTGNTHDLEPAALFLYREWLPASGEEMRNFPIYCQRFFPENAEQEPAAELFLPLNAQEETAES
ncbi:MAG: AraC family transcriptional regulator [Rhizobium sp.]|nr:AraC family transcriptional regulator [Rhizobium sp.]